MLRPESLRVGPPDTADADMTQLEGDVERVIYEGNSLLVQVRTRTADTVTARIGPDGDFAINAGMPVRLTWRFDAGVVLPA